MEPFCGSAALFFAASPKSATLSDANRWLIGTYQAIARDAEAVFRLSSQIPRTKEDYLRVREQVHQDTSSVTAAAAFVYLNRNCFNGIFRTNRAGRFNVPFSGQRTGPHPTLESFLSTAKALEVATLIVGDFARPVEENCHSGSFVYLDPPYATNNSRVFTQYDSHSFGTGDIARLAALLDDIDSVGGHFLVSYADVPEITRLRSRWNVTFISVQRHVSGFASGRRRATELLISNY